ncbi:MAG: hypothetical protein IJW13_01500 [Clostridia bacterium]|nr:hypothetical protein [Clostridia bacterium]
MPNPFIAILLLIAIFCILMVISFTLSIAYSSKAKAKKEQNEKAGSSEQEQPQNKIYYIEKYRSSPKKRKRRTPSIALKGTVVTPEEFLKRKD